MDDDTTVPDNDSSSTAVLAVIGNVENKDVAAGSCDGVGEDADAVTRKDDADVDESGNDNADDDKQFATADEKVTDDAPSKVEESLSSDGRKRPSNEEDDGEPLPTLPLKRARTAYFIFADEKRDEVKQQHPGEGVGTIAKAIGQLWSGLLPTEKEVYESKAAVERERVSRDMKRLVDAGLWPESGTTTTNADGRSGGGDTDDDAILFPVARIRKICKLDPDVKGISKESALLITKATELFCTKLAKECVIMAQMQNRRKLLPEDVVEVCSVKEAFMFLRSDLVDLRKAQVEEMNLKEKENGKERGGGSREDEEEGGTRAKSNTLDSYFGKVRS